MNGMSSCLRSLILVGACVASQSGLALSYDLTWGDKSLEAASKNSRSSQKILISVPDAQVFITHKNQPKTHIELNESAEAEYQVSQEGDLAFIRRRDGKADTKMDAKKKVIEIQSPSIALEIHLVQGEVQLSDWQQEALIHVQKGKVTALRNRSDIILHSLNGEMDVQQHQGRVEIDSFKANILVKDLQGDLRLDNFMGDSTIESAKGTLSLNQGQGNLKLTKSSGSLQFEQTKGVINVIQFLGRVEGSTQEGPVNVNMVAETDVNIKSQSGKVTIHAPPEGGVMLNLASQEGEIYAPTYLRVNREGSQKSLRARLKGEAQKGSIFVRTSEGGIFVR